METVLFVVTVASTGIALGAAFLVWRMRNREEERQRARVAALAAVINESTWTFDANELVDAGTPVLQDASARPLAEPAGELPRDLDLDGLDAHAPALFAGAEPAARAPRRGPALAVAAAVAVVLVTGALILGSPSAPPPQAAVTAPLELLALQQQQDGPRTVISGLVRNPAAGQPVRRLTAVVLLYDRAGAFVASSRAPLDYTTLRPGEESPFSVSLQDASPSATRYRLSFRLDERGVVPHVDRREKS